MMYTAGACVFDRLSQRWQTLLSEGHTERLVFCYKVAAKYHCSLDTHMLSVSISK